MNFLVGIGLALGIGAVVAAFLPHHSQRNPDLPRFLRGVIVVASVETGVLILLIAAIGIYALAAGNTLGRIVGGCLLALVLILATEKPIWRRSRYRR